MLKKASQSFTQSALNHGWVYTAPFTKFTRSGDVINLEQLDTPSTNQPTRLAIILGWWNSSHVQLRYYTQLYSQLGFHTVTHVAPTFQYPSLKAILRRHARLSRELQEITVNIPATTTLTHVLSNNGAMTAAMLHRIGLVNKLSSHSPTWTGLGTRPLLEDSIPSFPIKNMVFDSCPAPLNPRMLVNATLSLSEHPLDHWSSEPLFTYWNSFLSTSRIATLLDSQLYPAMDDLIPEKALMLTSPSDKVVPEPDILKWADKIQSKGTKVVRHSFENSPHVEHLKRHPQEYRQVVNAFIQAIEADSVDPWAAGRVGQAA